jgi:hypothetical protein
MWANDEVARPGILRILAWCALVFLASRGLLEVIGVGARLLGYPVMDPQYLPIAYSPQAWMDIWAVWDSGWFIDIVERGYDTSVRTDPRNEGQANWAFFPLYPMIAKALVMLTGMTSVAALIIIANIAFFATLPLIWYETAHWYGDRAADMAVALLAFLPGSFIFSSAYSSRFSCCSSSSRSPSPGAKPGSWRHRRRAGDTDAQSRYSAHRPDLDACATGAWRLA